MGRIIDPAGSQEEEAETKKELESTPVVRAECVTQKRGQGTTVTTRNPDILPFNLATKFTMWSLTPKPRSWMHTQL